MQIVTGYKGQAHITSNDDQGRNQGTFGTGGYVLSVGSKFAATIISANEIHIADGEGVFQGVHFRTRPSNYDSVTIENGVQGMLRKDLIVCRYRKEITGIESMDFIVIKGEAAASNPVRPSYTEGQILEDALVADMPMYEVSISGITVQGITPLFSVLKSMKELQDLETSLNSRIENLVKTKTTHYTQPFTIPENGYVLVQDVSYRGLQIISSMIVSWGSATGAFGIAWGSGNTLYIIGTPGVTVNNISVKIAYI